MIVPIVVDLLWGIHQDEKKTNRPMEVNTNFVEIIICIW